MSKKEQIMWIPIVGFFYGVYTIITEGDIHIPTQRILVNGMYQGFCTFGIILYAIEYCI